MKTFLISDHHFNHHNILNFKRDDGTPLRVFDNTSHMNEYMIECHNKVVGVNDKVYFLGDVAMGNVTEFDNIMCRLNGEKILIKGNHDCLKLANYVKWFKDIRATHILDKFILSHIPIHVESLGRWKANIHGHTHYRAVESSPHHEDKRYYSVCVERQNYTPVDFEYIRSLYKE